MPLISTAEVGREVYGAGWQPQGVDLTPAPAAAPASPGALTPAGLAGMLESRGWSRIAALGIAANAAHESGGANHTAALKPDAIGDNGNAAGLLQWNGPRKRALEGFAAARGSDWRDVATQLDFLEGEVGRDYQSLRARMNAAGDAGDAARMFALEFERPADAQSKSVQRAATAHLLAGEKPAFLSETLPAALRNQNSAVSIATAMNPGLQVVDPSFDPVAEAGKSEDLKPYLGAFSEVRNRDEFGVRAAQIRQQLADKETLDAAGWQGVVASIGAGILDPVNLIPMGGGAWRASRAANIALGAARTAAAGAVGAAGSEVLLQASQDTRTLDESMWTVGTATVLGGVLGGAVGAIGRHGLDEMARKVDAEIDAPPPTITPAVRAQVDELVDTEFKSVGAAAMRPGASEMQPGAPGSDLRIARGAELPARVLANTPLLSSPDLVLATSPVRESREAMRSLVRPALATEGDLAGVGARENVEAAAAQWHGMFYGATQKVRSVYDEYRVAAAKEGAKPLSIREFNELASAAGRRGDKADTLGVGPAGKAALGQAAAIYRREVFNPLRDEALKYGLLTQGQIDAAQRFAESYIPRAWQVDKIKAERLRFRNEVVLPSVYRDWEAAKAKLATASQITRHAEEQFRQVEAAGRELGGPEAAAFIEEGKARAPQAIIRDNIKALEEAYADPSVTWHPGDDTRARDLIAKARTPALARAGMEGIRKGGPALTDAEAQELQDIVLRTLGMLPGDAGDAGARAARAVRVMEDRAKALKGAADTAKAQAAPLAETPPAETAMARKAAALDARSRQAARDVQGIDREMARVAKRIERFTADPAPEELRSLISSARRKVPAEPESLLTFLRKNGGLQDDGGELSARDMGGSGGLIRKTGQRLDDATLRAWEAGYLGGGADRPSIDDLLAAIDSEAAGRKQYRVGDEAVIADREARADAEARLDDMGVTAADLKNLSPDEIFAKIEGRPAPKREPKRLSELRMEERNLQKAQRKIRDSVDTLSGDAAVMADNLRIAIELRTAKNAEARAIMEKQAADLAEEAARVEAMAKDYATATKKSLAVRAKAMRQLDKEDHLGRLDDADLEGVADDIINGLIGHTTNRIQYEGLAIKERGPMKSKTFNVRDTEVEEWIENDIEKLVQRYTSTMAADIELKRLTGDVNGDAMRAKIVEAYVEKSNGMPDGPAKLKLDKRLKADLEAFDGLVARQRGMYGLPSNAGEAWMLRSGRVLKALTFMTKMGWGPVSQVTDVARIIFHSGISRFMGDAIAPMVSNWRAVKLTKGELRLADIGNEVARGSMAMRGAEIFDDYGRTSAFERGMAAAAQGTATLFGLNHWNAGLKYVAGSIAQAKLARGVRALATGGEVKPMVLADLTRIGIGEREARQLHRFIEEFGEDVRGVTIPNTADWDGKGAVDAARLWRSAMSQITDDMVINPGQDRGLWLSKPLGSILGQLETFNLVSTQRTILAGLQRRDAAVVQGSVAMIGLGMLSFWLKAQIAGWDMPEDADDWLMKGITTSGLLGAVASVERRVAAATSGTVGFDAMTGSPSQSRYAAAGPLSLFGPNASMGEIVWTSGQAISRGDWSWRDTHRARTLIPMNNFFLGVRTAFDAGEDGLNQVLGVAGRPSR